MFPPVRAIEKVALRLLSHPCASLRLDGRSRDSQVTDGVWVTDGKLEVAGWSTDRVDVVRWFAEASDTERDPAELLDLVVAAGVLALRTANAAVDADYVSREFERLATALSNSVEDNGKRLEGLFDADRRDSAIGAIRELMAEHVDGRDSKMAKLLDASYENSPLRVIVDRLDGMHAEVEGYRRDLAARDAADEAWAEEHEIGTAKGRDFEDMLADVIGGIASVCGDSAEAVGDVVGCIRNSKHGDILVTLNPRDTRGVPVRVGIEAKDRALNAKSTRAALDATKANREALASIAVFGSGEQMPKGTYPFADLGESRFACLLDKDDPDDMLALTLAYRVARHWALADATGEKNEPDPRAIHDAIEYARNQLQSFTALKRKLTNLETGFSGGVADIRDEVDRARAALTNALDRLDESIRVVDESSTSDAA
jgi:hypothetical protein